MEFRETLLAAQRNQQQKSSENSYYKARFDPPKKEQKSRDRLSANIQKFLAKKEEEEKQKKLEAQRKREEFLAMRDPKALRKIQKTLKVIKSANKAAIEDAVDRDNTAVTLNGPEQPDQDDYGYESQEAAALYQKMMQKYSKIPDEPKFPTGNITVKKDLNGTRERVKHALQHEDDPVPHKRKRRTGGDTETDQSPPTKYEPEKEKKKEDVKPDKHKIRKPLPPPMDFNQLLKLAEEKKGDPLQAVQKKVTTEVEPERPMTMKQKKDYMEEMARRQRRLERLEAEKNGGKRVQKEEKPVDKEKRAESGGFGRIPKIGDKANNSRNDSPKPLDRDKIDKERAEKLQREKEKARMDRDKTERIDRLKADRLEREKLEREKERIDRERLELLKAERDRIERDILRLNKDRERLEKTKTKLEGRTDKKPEEKVDRTKINGESKNIDLKSQNTYRIDKNSSDKKLSIPKDGNGRLLNGHKPVPKGKETIVHKNGIKDKPIGNKPVSDRPINQPKVENGKRPLEKGNVAKLNDDRRLPAKTQPGPSKPKISNSFDFDKHVNSLKNGHDPSRNGFKRPGDVKKRPHPDDIRRKQKRRALDSESEYDSEMDDFIDDGDDEMDVSTHIKEIFGYDKSKYRYMDDDDDPTMESSFARQQREEYISKKIGIMEDLEDMRMEAMEKKKAKKSRRISDD